MDRRGIQLREGARFVTLIRVETGHRCRYKDRVWSVARYLGAAVYARSGGESGAWNMSRVLARTEAGGKTGG